MQGWCEPGSVAVLSAPGFVGVKRSSSGRSDHAASVLGRLSGTGPTMEEAAANAIRSLASTSQASSFEREI